MKVCRNLLKECKKKVMEMIPKIGQVKPTGKQGGRRQGGRKHGVDISRFEIFVCCFLLFSNSCHSTLGGGVSRPII